MVSIYFSFPDGVFDYVCAECTALCCRGQGFAGSLEREMGQLFTLYPSLESAVTERRGDVVSVATPQGRCHFLDGDNLCRIEKTHGPALKPGVCTLFPFNAFSLIGKTVVVSPHFMCPLRLRVPTHAGDVAGDVEGTHERLESAIRASGLVSEAQLKLSMRPARLHPSEGVRSVLARERAFRDRCGAALGRGSFCDVVRGASEDPSRLDATLVRAAALLGLEVPSTRAGRDQVDDILLAIAPTVRLELLRLPAQGILLVLALAELAVRRSAELSPAEPTPQSVASVITSMMPALRLLGCAGTPVITGRGRPKSPPFGDPAMVFASYRVLRAVATGADTLDLLEAGMQKITTVADRTAFLMEMGDLIAPSLKRTRA